MSCLALRRPLLKFLLPRELSLTHHKYITEFFFPLSPLCGCYSVFFCTYYSLYRIRFYFICLLFGIPNIIWVPYVCVCVCVCVCGARDQTQGVVHARQMLYHLSIPRPKYRFLKSISTVIFFTSIPNT
jgi:hypothetical protein